MNLHSVDWLIVFGTLLSFMVLAWYTKRYMRSVADFLAANRCGGRYMLGVAEGAATMGAISIIAQFEIFYQAGFSANWWLMMTEPIWLFIALIGWIYYRFRETRCFTLAQFFEVRYSKSFRVFCGILGFLAGTINFGIFPAVGSRFFIYFCGLPQSVLLVGMEVPTFILVMLGLLGMSLFFVFISGQISIMVTDFFQGILMYLAFAVMAVYLVLTFDFSDVIGTLALAEEGKSMINPFKSSKADDFDVWFYLIEVFAMFYTCMAWQGRGSYNSSAKNAHEAKMGKVIGGWRTIVIGMVLVYLPICAYVVMHNPKYSTTATEVTNVLATVDNSYLQEQLTTSIVLAKILPVGILGIFAAMMLAAFISTHDTYLHSWGSIFIQDVILPFRKKPFTPRQHIILLRLSILMVAIFIFLFSCLFVQRINIVYFFRVTGAIFVGGVGAVIIGGLYWKRGSTAAAWTAMISGSVIATVGTVLQHLWPSLYGKDFPINGQYVSMIAMVVAIGLYVIISLGGKTNFNMSQLLHRKEQAFRDKPVRGWKALVTDEFSRSDKIIYGIMISWVIGWTLVFFVGTIANFALKDGIPDDFWTKFWKFKVWLACFVSIITAIWFTIGGVMDVREMFKTLATVKRNALDSGIVAGNKNLDECETDK